MKVVFFIFDIYFLLWGFGIYLDHNPYLSKMPFVHNIDLCFIRWIGMVCINIFWEFNFLGNQKYSLIALTGVYR
jgi:hypothetical protein